MDRQRSFLLSCIVLAALAAFVVALPFLEYVLAAAVVAYLLSPLHRRLAPRVGGRVASLSLILGGLVVATAPLVYVGMALYRDMKSLARGDIDLQIAAVEDALAEQFGVAVDLEPVLQSAGRDALDLLTGSVGGVFATAMHTSLGVALFVFLVYYGLRDGPALVAWSREHSPLPGHVTDELYDQIEQTTWGVVLGHLLVALIQGLVGGLGLWIAGIPKVTFWTFVMIVLGLLPLIGAFVVWGAAAGYLVAIGDANNGLLLAAYGVLVVSSVDNFVRPIVIDSRADLNPGLILLGVFGGVYVLGFVGLFVGPILLGVLAATLTTYVEGYERLDATEAAAGDAVPGPESSGAASEQASPPERPPDDTDPGAAE